MPKTTKKGTPKQSELPSTLQRSDDKAQRTFAKAHDAAAESYGDEERAHRVAFSALKHTHEKVGDHWEPKEEPGPSDAQAEGGANTNRPTAGGVDANASKAHLMDVARRLDVSGRSKMTKDELVDAIQKANDRETRKARENGRTANVS
jgi:cation transport regulator ChaB